MSSDHCRVHFEVLEMFQTKLLLSIKRLEPLIKEDDPCKPERNKIGRWKYVLLHESLDKTISELEQWQRIFDPTWYLIILMTDKAIDSELLHERQEHESFASTSKHGHTNILSSSMLATAQRLRNMVRNDSTSNTHVTLSADGLNWESLQRIPYSTTQMIFRTGFDKLFLIESIFCDSNLDIPRARADAESLAKKLKQTEPHTFGLLSCQGLMKRKTQSGGTLSSIDLVFRLPDGKTRPVSLRHELLKRPIVSLTTILGIARQLATAVSFVHTCDFVHKNIRPETILLLADSELKFATGRAALGSLHLLGFDRFRSVNFHTMRRGDTAWERNLYRHPLRQGLRAQEEYVMQHDVYSLGVCLLELGLWESFVTYDDNPEGRDDQELKKVPSPILGLTLDDFDLNENLSSPSMRLKSHLVDLAKSKLPQRIGDRYTAVVVTCLTCLDKGNEDFGDEEDMRDDDGILIGLRFIEKILFRLSEISF
ncbi:hypothetical protein Hte_002692 [Hypoxylon texense]